MSEKANNGTRAERTLIVIPTLNEVGNIGELIHGIFTRLNDVHVLVVDDNSPDGTADFVQ